MKTIIQINFSALGFYPDEFYRLFDGGSVTDTFFDYEFDDKRLAIKWTFVGDDDLAAAHLRLDEFIGRSDIDSLRSKLIIALLLELERVRANG